MECSLTLAPWSSSAFASRYRNKNRKFIRVGLPWTSSTLSSWTSFPSRALFFASEVHTTTVNTTRRRTRKNTSSRGLNVELEIFKFMQLSGKPDVFPTKEELIAAGRSDLVEAALKKGGWLTFGWESDKPKASSAKNRGLHVNGAGKASNGSLISKDEAKRREVKADAQCPPAEVKETSLPVLDVETLKRSDESLKGTCEPGLEARSKARQRQPRNPISHKDKENPKTPQLPNAEASHERWRRKRRKELQPDNTTVKNALDWIQDMVQKREQLLMESISKPSQQSLAKSATQAALPRRASPLSKGFTKTASDLHKDVKGSSVPDIVPGKEQAPEEGPAEANSFNNRLRKLETKLLTTRAALKSGRASLLKGEDKLLQVQRKTGEDLAKAADYLEFRETEIMQTRAELRRTRAQVTALQAKMALELSEARKATEEKQLLLDRAEAALKMMRLVRIVWPNPASHVQLTGSFDGWTNKIKMEKSSAGVFVTALHLYPGRYEVKFIVDGTWRVDPCRPITYADGIENNVLIVS